MGNMATLSLCAYIEANSESYARLREHLAQNALEPGLVDEAERHGMGPLVYRHLKAAQASIPPAMATTLAGVYLRHRHANDIRTRILSELLDAFHANGISVLVVKGGALAHMLYPDSALRPMSDLDLLVEPKQLGHAATTLQELGMGQPVVDPGQGGKGLATAGKTCEDVYVGVELHTDLFETGFPASMSLQDLSAEPLAFRVGPGGPSAYTLGTEDLIWHLCEHLRFHTTVFLPWRLIWMVDIVAVAEGRAGPVDWGKVRDRYPSVLRTLSLVDCLCPLTEPARARAGIVRSRTPRGIGEDFDGWPRHSLADQGVKCRRVVLRDSLAPSEWWLRLHYGLDTDAPAWRQRWVAHPLDISRRAANMLIHRH